MKNIESRPYFCYNDRAVRIFGKEPASPCATVIGTEQTGNFVINAERGLVSICLNIFSENTELASILI